MSCLKVDYRFKILYAVAIVMVVAHHCGEGGIALDFSGWFPYDGMHLALFVFGSGYFFDDKSNKHVGAYIKKKVRKLIIPMYIYNCIYGVFIEIIHMRGFTIGNKVNTYNLIIAPLIDGHQFCFNMGSWFVVPLFFVEVYNIFIRIILNSIIIKHKETIYLIINICIGMIGNSLACNGLISGWWLLIARTTYFIPFFALGVYYHKVLEKYDKNVSGLVYFSVLFVLKLIIYIHYKKIPVYTPSWCHDFVDGPIMPIIIGILGIAFWLRITKILEPAIGENRYINIIADNTYSIMINQFIGFWFVNIVYMVLYDNKVIITDFDIDGFHQNIWYLYTPYGINNTRIVYLVAGIVIPIYIQKLINYVKNKVI